MEDRLKEILETHAKQLERYENKCSNLLSRMQFCKEHNFNEEERITRMEYDAINMIVYNYKLLYRDIEEMLNERPKPPIKKQ